jgi:hypothetical protein
MSRLEAWFVHVANILVGGTGLVYAWMRYFARSADPFAVVNHPWQPAVQHVHIVVAPLLVFAVGLIWRSHVWTGFLLSASARRRSGVLLLGTAAPMVASGYLLQTATGPAWRTAWLGVHLAASALWVAATLVHQMTPRRRTGRPAPS